MQIKMDRHLSGKSKKLKYLTIGAVIFLALALMAYLSVSKKRALNVAADELLIKTVSEGYFEDYIILQAKAEPLQAMFVNILEGGSVQEIYAENGTIVQQGQPLAKLYNPNTELGYLTQETAIIEQMNNLNTGKLSIRNQELGLTKELATIDHDYNDAKRLYDLNEKLFQKGVISKNDWNAIAENFRFQTERRDNIQLSIQKEKQANRIQISQINQSIGTMEKSLEILRNNKKNFLITAPVSGRLTAFEPILGQTFPAGASIAKIDVMRGYKLVAEVDEFYLDKVGIGQKGEIDHKGKSHQVTVSKVLPEVKQNGRFEVELMLSDELQPSLQQGISFGIKLQLSEKEKVVLLPKGKFHSETAGNWIFVLKGNKAERREIKIGRENPAYYEVLSGLKAGEQVITSAYTDYKDVEQLNLNQ